MRKYIIIILLSVVSSLDIESVKKCLKDIKCEMNN